MTTRTPDRSRSARLVEIAVTGGPAAWIGAGFTVEADRIAVGPVDLRLVDRPVGTETGGIVGWTVAGLDGPDEPSDIDGLPTVFADGSAGTGGADSSAAAGALEEPHPNGVTGLDHIVVMSPDLDRTIAAFEGLQLRCRRIRDARLGGTPIRQAFFRLGPTIVEVVGAEPTPDGRPAGFWGLSFDAEDLDVAAVRLGAALGPIRPAVQEERRIATIRTGDLGIDTRVALMDHHRERAGA